MVTFAEAEEKYKIHYDMNNNRQIQALKILVNLSLLHLAASCKSIRRQAQFVELVFWKFEIVIKFEIKMQIFEF